MKNRIGFLELLLYVTKHKKLVISTVLLASILAVTYSLLAPKYWSSKATFFPAETSSMISFGEISKIRESLFTGSMQPASSELTMIMESDTFSEKVIKHFNLVERLEITGRDSLEIREKAIKKLMQDIVNFSIDEETGLIVVSVMTKDKYLSAEIANYYTQLINQYNKKTRKTKGRRTRKFIEQRLTEVENKIDSLSIAIKNFQEKTNLIDLETQVKKSVELYSELISKKMIAQIEYNIKESYLDIDSFNLQKLKKQISEYDKLINSLEGIQKNKDFQYIIKLKNVPKNALKLGNLKMELKIQQTVYEFLYPQYESARIDELRDSESIVILDEARPAGKRTKPRRAIICITTFIIALLASIILSILIEISKEYLKDEEEQKLITNIKSNLFHK
ncbi:MAG: hypothetical protein PWQ09_751 [Candidatus Cloacimonadota bacterium]|jgi:uncharacterized protein involved in exopolysaccharide biosynthesis|nr:hypothetical protein [Candidatus Cloacimonadota bacterium]